MRYALIADIHANLPALEAVLADLDARTDIDAVYHLGDIGGYAPRPNETIDLLRRQNAFVPEIEWDSFPIDTFDGLGVHAIECLANATETAQRAAG